MAYVIKKGTRTVRYLKDFIRTDNFFETDELWTMDLSEAMLFDELTDDGQVVRNGVWSSKIDEEETVIEVTVETKTVITIV